MFVRTTANPLGVTRAYNVCEPPVNIPVSPNVCVVASEYPNPPIAQRPVIDFTLYIPESYNKIKLCKFSTINEKMVLSVSTNDSMRI